MKETLKELIDRILLYGDPDAEKQLSRLLRESITEEQAMQILKRAEERSRQLN